MSVLKSVLIVIAAGVATVVLAIGAKAGLKAAGVTVDRLLLSGISVGSMIIVVGLFAWRIRRNGPVSIARPSEAVTIGAMLIAGLVQLTLMLAVLIPMGVEENWPLSLGGLLAMAFVTPQILAARQAAKAAGK